MIASTSTGSAGALADPLVTLSKLGLGEAAVVGAFVGVVSRCPVMRSQILPKMLMVFAVEGVTSTNSAASITPVLRRCAKVFPFYN